MFENYSHTCTTCIDRIGIICLILIVFTSCGSKKKNEKVNYKHYVLGGFYPNNHLNTKDSNTHFQHICHFSLLLTADTLEIYNRNSVTPNQNEYSCFSILTDKDRQKFESIVTEYTNVKQSPKNPNSIYDGLTYVASISEYQNVKYAIQETGMKKEDEAFIFHFIQKSEKLTKANTSNLMKKENYFMTGLLQQESGIIIENKIFN